MRLWLVFLYVIYFAVTPAFAENPQTRNDEIRSAIDAFLLQKNIGADFEAHIKRMTLPSSGSLPTTGELDYEVIAPPQWEGWGNVNLAVVVRQGDRILRNIPVRLEIEALTEMVVTTRQIEHGATVSAQDVTIRKQELASTKGVYLKKTDDVIGRRIKVALRANKPIRPDQIEKIALIRAGQIVTAVMERASLRISMTAKAKQSGALGDIITVQNINSLKEFSARIIDANTVQVIL